MTLTIPAIRLRTATPPGIAPAPRTNSPSAPEAPERDLPSLPSVPPSEDGGSDPREGGQPLRRKAC